MTADVAVDLDSPNSISDDVLEYTEPEKSTCSAEETSLRKIMFGEKGWRPLHSLREEIGRRLNCYISDFTDGLTGKGTLFKLFSSIAFLYFACLLPSIAFGVLNDDNTEGMINVRKVLMAQGIVGILFSLTAGQPFVILLTTAPLAIYIKVIYTISSQMGYDFYAMYAWVGLFCQLFLILYAVLDLCCITKLSTRSIEETFAVFIAIAFTVDGVKDLVSVFNKYYSPAMLNGTMEAAVELQETSTRETAILYLFLMLGTLWLAAYLLNFRQTPYFTRLLRDQLADYALPAAVVLMSIIGSLAFSAVSKDQFKMRLEIPLWQFSDLSALSGSGFGLAVALGFSLSLLFFMDQNISAALVEDPQFGLKKGAAPHLDLLVVAILNIFLSLLGLPWMHGALPHSPLHVRALADIRHVEKDGKIQETFSKVRETRLAALISHILILLTAIFLIPYPLQYIPTSVLYGIFLYMAMTSLLGNQFFERILLFITERKSYPSSGHLSKVPILRMHIFTGLQLAQLVLLAFFGLFPQPFVQMVFPVILFLFIPIRHFIVPLFVQKQHLQELDSRH